MALSAEHERIRLLSGEKAMGEIHAPYFDSCYRIQSFFMPISLMGKSMDGKDRVENLCVKEKCRVAVETRKEYQVNERGRHTHRWRLVSVWDPSPNIFPRGSKYHQIAEGLPQHLAVPA
jgi:hypothetical protein